MAITDDVVPRGYRSPRQRRGADQYAVYVDLHAIDSGVYDERDRRFVLDRLGGGRRQTREYHGEENGSAPHCAGPSCRASTEVSSTGTKRRPLEITGIDLIRPGA